MCGCGARRSACESCRPCGRAEPLPTRLSRAGVPHPAYRRATRSPRTRSSSGPREPCPASLPRSRWPWRWPAAGPTKSSPRPTSTADSPAPQGRPIGADADARVYAVAAAVRFVARVPVLPSRTAARGASPGRKPGSCAPRSNGCASRQPSGVRQTEIVGAQLERIDALSARVTVRVRNVDERLTYPLPIDLVRRDGRWIVLSAGDDT